MFCRKCGNDVMRLDGSCPRCEASKNNKELASDLSLGMALTTCQECGMTVPRAGEYHSFAVCLIYKQCQNRQSTIENIRSTIEYGMRAERQGKTIEQAMAGLVER